MSVQGVLRRQAGVISRKQALAAGMSGSAVSAKLSAGRWRALHPGVFLTEAHDWTMAGSVRAAVLWAGSEATLSGPAAAWWHGMIDDFPGAVDVTVPRRQCPGARPNVRVRRRDLHPEDRVVRRGLAVTAKALTALEAAVALGSEGGQLLDRALQCFVEFSEVYRAHCRNLGRYGSAEAVRMLTASADRAASHAERIMIKLLRRTNLTGWVRGYRIGSYELDFAFPAQRIAIEVDGWAWHSDVERFRHDRRRQNALVEAGWTVLRFTWHDLTQRPEVVIATIGTVLADRAGS